MGQNNKPVGRKDEIVVQEVGGEVLIYDLRTDKAFCLNPTSAVIWKLCDGQKNVAEISEVVAKELNAKISEDLVWLALDQLRKENLIDGGLDTGYNHFAGMSRREVVRKVAVGSAVAIPIIAGLVAPPAYAIGSNCGNTCRCRNNFGFAAGAVCPTPVGNGGIACDTSGPIPNDCTICHANGTIPPGNQPTAVRAGTCSMT